MPDVEFLTGDGTDGHDEDLESGPRRGSSRWVVLGCVLVLVAVLAVVVARNHSTPDAAPAPSSSSSSPSSSSPTGPGPSVVPNLQLSDPFDLTGDDRAHRIFALTGTQLFAIGPDGRPTGRSAPVQVGDLTDAQVELVEDEANHVLWAVPQNATGHDGLDAGFAEPFDTRTLHAYGRLSLPGRIESAAVLGGELFVTTESGLWRASLVGAPFERVAGRRVGDALLVADPVRDRLICLHFGKHTTAAFYRLGGLSRARPLPPLTVSLAVVGRTIWLGGRRGGHTLLTTLDPATLRTRRPVVSSGPDVELQGAGRRSLYVTVGERLECLSGTDGHLLHDFGRLSGEFVSVDGRGFVGTVDALKRVPMGRCPG